jgi:hypothetical protein
MVCIRPDVFFRDNFPIEMLGLLTEERKGIIIPQWDEWEGINDRFCITRFEDGCHYMNRIDKYLEIKKMKRNARTTSEYVAMATCVRSYKTIYFTDFKFDIIRREDIKM